MMWSMSSVAREESERCIMIGVQVMICEKVDAESCTS